MFAVCHDPGPLEATRSGLLVGPLWVRLAGADFPESGWVDCPVPALGWWLSELLGMASSADSARLSFMEGPCWVRLERRDGVVAAEAVWDDEVRHSVTGLWLPQVLSSVHEAAAQALRAARAVVGTSPDVDELARLVGVADRFVASREEHRPTSGCDLDGAPGDRARGAIR